MSLSSLWVVRVVLSRDDNIALPNAGGDTMMWIEQFRYAGYVKILRDDDDGVCFDIVAPKPTTPVESKVWADMTAARMESFNINAVAAPEFKE